MALTSEPLTSEQLFRNEIKWAYQRCMEKYECIMTKWMIDFFWENSKHGTTEEYIQEKINILNELIKTPWVYEGVSNINSERFQRACKIGVRILETIME